MFCVSLECSECERDLRGGHDRDCLYLKKNRKGKNTMLAVENSRVDFNKRHRGSSRVHQWETITYPNNRRCEKCALVEEPNTPYGSKRTYSRGGNTVRVIGEKSKLPPCI